MRTKVVPQWSPERTATPSDDATVLLEWARGGNPDGVMFQGEAQNGTGRGAS